MSYIVFARKWRPQDFDEVVGQDHITTTLKNAIRLNRVAHAYLFTGPRGIGKTSTARILAKALNCQEGPTVNPCNRCSPCKEISEGRSLDCIEIDGASNRGIDEVRNLRENVKFSPSSGKFKIYIIDEVHMLTQEAFNALLKTLEEPPPHVKFVFATTQPHKLPLTIASRCQRFDFRRISIDEIIFKLKAISQKEGLQTSEEALFAIAKAAEGSMRDAESLLDQLASFCQGKIDAQAVISILGMVDQEILFELTQKIIERDTAGALKMVDSLINEGKDLMQFLSNLIEHFRNLMLAKVGKDTERLIDLPKELIERIFKQSQGFSTEEILYSFQVLINAREMMKHSTSLRIPLEMAVVKLAKRENISSLTEILEKLSQLEKKWEEKDSLNLQSQNPIKLEDDPSPESNPHQAGPKEDPDPPLKNSLTLDIVNEHWQNFIEKIGGQKISTASYLSEGQPLKVENNCITIGFPEGASFHREALERLENKKLIERSLAEVFNENLKVMLTQFDCPESDRPHRDKKELPKEKEDVGREVEPIVKSALEIFKGKIIKRLKREEGESD
jgi:DNA polymerase-3 subunit gamma/tau